MAALDNIAADKGLRRPWTMIAAEAALWLLAVPAVFLFGSCLWKGSRGSFELEMIPQLAFFAWRMVLPVLVHCGLRLVVTLGVLVELALYPGFYRYALTWDLHLALGGTHLLPLVLLWLPPSVRWCTMRNLNGRKGEGAAADSHPKNSEDGHKAPFIDNKIAFYLSYVNGGMNGK